MRSLFFKSRWFRDNSSTLSSEHSFAGAFDLYLGFPLFKFYHLIQCQSLLSISRSLLPPQVSTINS